MMVESPSKYLLTHITFKPWLGLILTQIHWLTLTLRNAMTSDPGELNNITKYLAQDTHTRMLSVVMGKKLLLAKVQPATVSFSM